MKIYPIKPPTWLIAAGTILGYVLMSPLIFIMWVQDKCYERFGPKYGQWQLWFAWRPVRLGWFGASSKGWVWLETVERTLFYDSPSSMALYRRPGDETVISTWDHIDPEEG